MTTNFEPCILPIILRHYSQIQLIIENNKNRKKEFDQNRDHAFLIQRIIMRPVSGLVLVYYHQNHCQKQSRVFEKKATPMKREKLGLNHMIISFSFVINCVSGNLFLSLFLIKKAKCAPSSIFTVV